MHIVYCVIEWCAEHTLQFLDSRPFDFAQGRLFAGMTRGIAKNPRINLGAKSTAGGQVSESVRKYIHAHANPPQAGVGMAPKLVIGGRSPPYIPNHLVRIAWTQRSQRSGYWELEPTVGQ
jgi:hypothetical protein